MREEQEQDGVAAEQPTLPSLEGSCELEKTPGRGRLPPAFFQWTKNIKANDVGHTGTLTYLSCLQSVWTCVEPARQQHGMPCVPGWNIVLV